MSGLFFFANFFFFFFSITFLSLLTSHSHTRTHIHTLLPLYLLSFFVSLYYYLTVCIFSSPPLFLPHLSYVDVTDYRLSDFFLKLFLFFSFVFQLHFSLSLSVTLSIYLSLSLSLSLFISLSLSFDSGCWYSYSRVILLSKFAKETNGRL